MHRAFLRPLVILAGLAVFAVPAVANADPVQAKPGAGYTEQKVQGGTVVNFPDDPLGAEGLDANIATITVITPKFRANLASPRLNFVPEMLRSVETM